MREIKFRGYSKKYKTWYIGDLSVNSNGHFQIKHKLENGSITIASVENDTVGQYIGLKDKNGKEIFEGDILDCQNCWWDTKHKSQIIEVKYNANISGFEPFCIYDNDCCYYIYSKDVIVIGNIYDNPELLKNTEDD